MSTYQNEKVPFLHVRSPYHTKLIKTAGHKLALMEGTHSNRQRDLLLCDILINEKHHITTFAKAFKYQTCNEKKKTKTKTTQNKINLSFRVKDCKSNAVS